MRKPNRLTTATMKLALPGLFLFVLYGLTTGIVKVHIYMTTPKRCSDAQKLCQLLFTEMSKLSDEMDLLMLEKAAGGAYNHSWISSDQDDVNSCKLVRFQDSIASVVEYLFRVQQQSACVIAKDGHWQSISCSDTFPFFCYENLILVQEKKTWKEALEYCRSHYTDLAYLGHTIQLNQIKNETKYTDTDSVWTGLRFVTGHWIWVGNKYFEFETKIVLPLCPSEPYRCGAHNTKTEQWENRDCAEKLNFLCFMR